MRPNVFLAGLVWCAAALVASTGGQAAPGVVLHGVPSPEGCGGERPHGNSCVYLAPQGEVGQTQDVCVDVYLTGAQAAKAAQMGFRLGTGWSFVGWNDGNVQTGSSFVTTVDRDLMICVVPVAVDGDTMSWVGTLECVTGGNGTGLQLAAPALPSGAAVLTADNEIVSLDEDGSDALVVGGSNIVGCGSGPMRMGRRRGAADTGQASASITKRTIPNPIRTGALIEWAARAEPITMEIYDINGRLLRTVRDDGRWGGLRARWDGLAENGRSLDTGLYLVRIQQGSSAWNRKILFIR